MSPHGPSPRAWERLVQIWVDLRQGASPHASSARWNCFWVRSQPRKKLPPGSRLSEWKLLTIEPTAPRIGNTRHATHV
jgi:hypothetical protein